MEKIWVLRINAVFKILLKHLIYETCIDVFFSHLIVNFSDIEAEEYFCSPFSSYALPLIKKQFPVLLAKRMVVVDPSQPYEIGYDLMKRLK